MASGCRLETKFTRVAGTAPMSTWKHRNEREVRKPIIDSCHGNKARRPVSLPDPKPAPAWITVIGSDTQRWMNDKDYKLRRGSMSIIHCTTHPPAQCTSFQCTFVPGTDAAPPPSHCRQSGNISISAHQHSTIYKSSHYPQLALPRLPSCCKQQNAEWGPRNINPNPGRK